jgi:hypothetical protein
MNIRMLKFIVIAMGLLIVTGVTVLVATIVNRVADRSETGSAPADQIVLSLPEGARIVETVMDNDRLALRIETAQGDQILIVDLASGKVISTVETAGQTP